MKRILRSGLSLVFVASMLGLPLFGCKTIEAHVDCRAICHNFKDCYDATVDENACRDRCEDVVEENDDIRVDANDCDQCLVDNAGCAKSIERCSVCDGVRASFQ